MGEAPGDLVETVAAALQQRLPDLTGALRDRLSTRIEELDGDAAIIELLYASIEGNIENILYSLRHDITLDKIEPPSAAYEYARRLAQRGVAVSALVRAYRLGQQHLLELMFAECERMDAEPAARAAAYEEVVAVTFDYIDWISQRVITVYEDERERWLAERSNARVGRVQELIAGRVADVDAAETVLGYRLRVPHLGAVLWVHEAGTQQDQLARFTRAAGVIAEQLGSTRAPLIIPHDRATAWAWFAVADDVVPDLDQIAALLTRSSGPPVPRVALGRPSSGVEGFRRTHREALDAQQVAMVGDDARRTVTGFDEPGLKIAALLAHDLDTARTWVQETLGDLARDDEQHERLRHTLLLFFQNDSSYTATAEAMLMHKNSVKYRIASAEKALGRSISSDRQAIELALTACHWLGRAVLVGVA
ncbi:PucR family transcriptional regulator [Pimelobacter simplex]|uniref:PucR family transcriptional regulator n=1 Tax=Nocardioides simplex TaxID=2045 RepID=UPI002150687A|nr:helix-turn-helix domain-containing protein [Pimelobacter simplex]UUW87272.1 helix-turn-helix domain-containing protein [Pimelobacter simplex]UUW96778.1 helix-turn-helix domain-containing protein [Pimelobacter simplex]